MIGRAATLSRVYWSLSALLVATLAYDAHHYDSFTIAVFCLWIAGAVAIPRIPWQRWSHNIFSLIYVVSITSFAVTALHFNNAYVLLAIYPNLIALADIYWYRRLLTVTNFTLITAVFVVCSALIDGAGRTNVLVAGPVMIVTALAFGAASSHITRAHFERQRFVSTVKSLLEALYMRDGYTGEHSEATLALVDAVADEMSLPDGVREDLRDVALLHDIGKIGIPNAILQKPAKLTPEEWEVMRRHPEIGEEILGEVPGFERLAKAIRHEHERWDGGGYPDGVAGPAIPLASRIVLACDAYHAMVSDRPYRPAMSQEDARAELLANAGTQFDPIVVQALIAAIDAGRVDAGDYVREPDSAAGLLLAMSEDAGPVAWTGDQLYTGNVVPITSEIGEPVSDAGAEPQLREDIPGVRSMRAASLFIGWFLNFAVVTTFMAFSGFETAGSAFAAASLVVAVLSLFAGNRMPRSAVLMLGLICYPLVPYIAWQLDEPALIACLIVPCTAAMALYWENRTIRSMQLFLLVADFVAVPFLIADNGLVFAVVSLRAFPGMILAAALMIPSVTEMSFDRRRFSSTMVSLLKALQARDGYTGEHSEETLDLAMRVAGKLNLDEAQRSELRDVALLHDIGKIGIPDEILHKPGKLDAGEWEVMRRHPAIGERIVGAVPGFGSIAKAIRHEHERWDGAGYPDGIAGNEIPLASRIVLVCDAFHAMTSDRPYRKSLGVAVALEELSKNSGTQFDPAVVKALLETIGDHKLRLVHSEPMRASAAVG